MPQCLDVIIIYHDGGAVNDCTSVMRRHMVVDRNNKKQKLPPANGDDCIFKVYCLLLM